MFNFETVDPEDEYRHDFIHSDKIRKGITSLPNKLIAGPDFIQAIFVIKIFDYLLTPLHIIFTQPLRECTFPDVWKRAFICLVLKGDENTLATNYRPISIICNFVKVFEKIIIFIYPNINTVL